jgi:molybdopterin synthase catalytic subunit
MTAIWQCVRVQTETFDMGAEEKSLRAHAGDCGALVAFMGLVREFDAQDNPVQVLHLEHFAGVTEHAIEQIIEQAQARWDLTAATVIHRVGQLHAHEPIVLVMVASAHRESAFLAAQFIMDVLKTTAPFWKKEQFADGSAQWVNAKDSDANASSRWDDHADRN